jgi:hypothetical protein
MWYLSWTRNDPFAKSPGTQVWPLSQACGSPELPSEKAVSVVERLAVVWVWFPQFEPLFQETAASTWHAFPKATFAVKDTTTPLIVPVMAPVLKFKVDHAWP